jgi:hypothetical protein
VKIYHVSSVKDINKVTDGSGQNKGLTNLIRGKYVGVYRTWCFCYFIMANSFFSKFVHVIVVALLKKGLMEI